MNVPGQSSYLFLTTEEVAARYRVSIRTVEGWNYRGVGPASVRIGGRRLFPIHSLAQFEQITGF